MEMANVHSLRPGSFWFSARADADAATVRSAARLVASGVCVVTVGSGETRAGMTAVSVSLISTEPAALLVCLNRASADYRAFTQSSAFAVNVLGGDQREIAHQFTGNSEVTAIRRDECRWLPLADGLSCLADCAAVFDCELEETIVRGDTAMVIMRVRRAAVGSVSDALVRWRGVYDQLGWSRDEISRAVGLAPGR